MNRQDYINLLKNKFVKCNNIDLVILYGFVLTERFNEKSDIDIVIAGYKHFSPFLSLN